MTGVQRQCAGAVDAPTVWWNSSAELPSVPVHACGPNARIRVDGASVAHVRGARGMSSRAPAQPRLTDVLERHCVEEVRSEEVAFVRMGDVNSPKHK